MEAVGEIGWIIIALFLFISVMHPIGLPALTVWRTAFFAEQREHVRTRWLIRVPPGYVLEVAWFFVLVATTVGFFFWLHAKADIDPWYDVVNALYLLLHILIKVYIYLVYTTQNPTGAAATIGVTWAVSVVIWAIVGAVDAWKFFWWWAIMPVWLFYVCLFSVGIAVHPIPPLPTKEPSVGPPEDLKI